ncbi:MAG TPA: glycosyltransferase family 4 protein [Thermoanaerobaculia bacterium]|nr:glycosyltransferase family 4 protein [Thermoanaerobaculia bacterium]
MKICLWFRTVDGPWGGGNQFLKALGRELSARGHAITDWPSGGEDLLLINAFNAGANRRLNAREVADVRRSGKWTALSPYTPVALSRARRRRGPAIVHRLDGVGIAVRGVATKADDVQSAVNALTDATIFQTEYCLTSFAAHGVTPAHYTIIPNGVDGSIFYPSAAPRPLGKKLVFIGSSWSSNPRKGFATLAALSEVPDVEVRFAGRWPEAIDSRNVVLLGAKSSHDLADALRDADAMVHAAQNEPCSNAVLEALACGLPVLYLDSGGTREIAGDYGVAIGSDLAANVDALRASYDALRERVRAERSRFLIEAAATAYLREFEIIRSLRG